MTHGQLFAGIGGFGLAASWAGITNVWANEIDEYCCKVLRQNFKGLEVYEKDIREIGSHNLQPVSILSGGFPCQPFSAAGLKKGSADNRFLWPEMLRVIDKLQPKWVIGENVVGIVSMENGSVVERIFNDLENIKYKTEAYIIPSSSVGAWHRRERIWFISHNTCIGGPWGTKPKIDGSFKYNERNKASILQWESKSGVKRNAMWESEPEICRMVHGIPRELDETKRIKALGNAIVPQVAYEIFKAIIEHELNKWNSYEPRK